MSQISADDRLRSFVDRIERLNEENDAINTDKREVFSEARGAGYDVKALKAVIGIRKKRAADPDGLQEHDHMVALYLEALDRPKETGHAHTPAPAGEAQEASVASTPRKRDSGPPRDLTYSDVRAELRNGTLPNQDFQFDGALVYFAIDDAAGRLKVGISKNVEQRLRQLGPGPVGLGASEGTQPVELHTQGVAQPGSAPGLEPGGRRFESSRPDQPDDGLDIPTFMKRDANNRAPWMEGTG